MKKRTFLQSLNDAADGFVWVVRHEKNMRVHFLAAALLLVAATALGVSRLEWIVLCCASALVLIAEMMNTAIEETMDLVKREFHPAVRIVKHISAGIVLVTVVNSLIVAFFVFSPYLRRPFAEWITRVRYAPVHLLFTSLLAVTFAVVAAKAFGKKGTPFRGGILSGHSAVAFSFWTVVVFITTEPFIVGVTFLMAAFVAQSRLRAKIHSLQEVVLGSLVGMIVTALFFSFFR